MSATDFGDPHQIIHIPARDLTGMREAKLAELDTFLAQLLIGLRCVVSRFDWTASLVRRMRLERSITVTRGSGR